MTANYELFDRRTANLIGSYDFQDEALRVVREAVANGLAGQLADVVLGKEDKHGNTDVLLSGQQLIGAAVGEPANV